MKVRQTRKLTLRWMKNEEPRRERRGEGQFWKKIFSSPSFPDRHPPGGESRSKAQRRRENISGRGSLQTLENPLTLISKLWVVSIEVQSEKGKSQSVRLMVGGKIPCVKKPGYLFGWGGQLPVPLLDGPVQ